MPSRFSFDGALMFAFRAAHARNFLWMFPLAFAGAFAAWHDPRGSVDDTYRVDTFS
tara:strand:+ start:1351 stop:1518 length:168 start_codon:yes stop_codon:yes gene_type:complete